MEASARPDRPRLQDDRFARPACRSRRTRNSGREPRRVLAPVALPDGSHDASFRVVRLGIAIVPNGRVFFCHHFTPELVWRDEWRQHPNGVIDIVEFVIAAADPRSDRRALSIDLRQRCRHPRSPGGFSLQAGRATVFFLTPEEVGRRLRATPRRSATDASDRMVALTLKTRSLAGRRGASSRRTASRSPARQTAFVVPHHTRPRAWLSLLWNKLTAERRTACPEVRVRRTLRASRGSAPISSAKEAFDDGGRDPFGRHVDAGNIARDRALAQRRAMIDEVDARELRAAAGLPFQQFETLAEIGKVAEIRPLQVFGRLVAIAPARHQRRQRADLRNRRRHPRGSRCRR